jgi:hypothetical protein
MLSKKQVENYCLPYAGYTRCRYLSEDDNDFSKFYCLKKSHKKKDIDEEIQLLFDDLKGKKLDDKNIAVGDNCSGFIVLKNIEQGFDVKRKT